MNSEDTPGSGSERRPGGALAAEVLALLQASGEPLTAGQVQQRLSERLAYSTVVTVLSRIFDKGLLTRSKEGRAFAYAPVADTHGLTAWRMRQVLESDPDREAVLTRFVDALPSRDEELLRHLLGSDLPDGE